jgi:hypothetical protein
VSNDENKPKERRYCVGKVMVLIFRISIEITRHGRSQRASLQSFGAIGEETQRGSPLKKNRVFGMAMLSATHPKKTHSYFEVLVSVLEKNGDCESIEHKVFYYTVEAQK